MVTLTKAFLFLTISLLTCHGISATFTLSNKIACENATLSTSPTSLNIPYHCNKLPVFKTNKIHVCYLEDTNEEAATKTPKQIPKQPREDTCPANATQPLILKRPLSLKSTNETFIGPLTKHETYNGASVGNQATNGSMLTHEICNGPMPRPKAIGGPNMPKPKTTNETMPKPETCNGPMLKPGAIKESMPKPEPPYGPMPKPKTTNESMPKQDICKEPSETIFSNSSRTEEHQNADAETTQEATEEETEYERLYWKNAVMDGKLAREIRNMHAGTCPNNASQRPKRGERKKYFENTGVFFPGVVGQTDLMGRRGGIYDSPSRCDSFFMRFLYKECHDDCY